MSPDFVIDISRQALHVTTLVAAPMLLAALVIGLIIGMVQAATQINEMTLSFIPKLLALVGALLIAGPWMLNLLITFTRGLIERIPQMIG
jgi:flagellar biosynthetic protein FliQ